MIHCIIPADWLIDNCQTTFNEQFIVPDQKSININRYTINVGDVMYLAPEVTGQHLI